MDLKQASQITEILPKSGLVYSEKGGFAEILCKPKILPLKSAVLEQLQKLEQAAEEEETSNNHSIDSSLHK
jgi:BBSome-interacting protein 1